METLVKQIKSISNSNKYNQWIINGLIAVGVIQLTVVFANVKKDTETYMLVIAYALGFLKAVLVEGSVKHFSNSVIRMRLAFAPKRGRKSGKTISPEEMIKAKKFKLQVVIVASAFANCYHAVTDFTGGSFDFSMLNWGQIVLVILFSALIPYVVYALSVDSADEMAVLDSLSKERAAARKTLERKIERSKYSEKKKYIAQLNALNAM